MYMTEYVLEELRWEGSSRKIRNKSPYDRATLPDWVLAAAQRTVSELSLRAERDTPMWHT